VCCSGFEPVAVGDVKNAMPTVGRRRVSLTMTFVRLAAGARYTGTCTCVRLVAIEMDGGEDGSSSSSP
jgi:hypothetical protein